MAEPSDEKLTAKETEVLKMIGNGSSSKEIAAALHVSLLTVANHRKHICAKLQLHSTAALVAYAARVVQNAGGQ
jgi:DNA-binding CsgD family transcriptional regulator